MPLAFGNFARTSQRPREAEKTFSVPHERVVVGHHPHGAVPHLGFAPAVMLPAQLLEGSIEALEVVDVPPVDFDIGAVLAR